MFQVISYSFTEDIIAKDCEAAEVALKQGNLPVSCLVSVNLQRIPVSNFDLFNCEKFSNERSSC